MCCESTGCCFYTRLAMTAMTAMTAGAKTVKAEAGDEVLLDGEATTGAAVVVIAVVVGAGVAPVVVPDTDSASGCAVPADTHDAYDVCSVTPELRSVVRNVSGTHPARHPGVYG